MSIELLLFAFCFLIILSSSRASRLCVKARPAGPNANEIRAPRVSPCSFALARVHLRSFALVCSDPALRSSVSRAYIFCGRETNAGRNVTTNVHSRMLAVAKRPGNGISSIAHDERHRLRGSAIRVLCSRSFVFFNANMNITKRVRFSWRRKRSISTRFASFVNNRGVPINRAFQLSKLSFSPKNLGSKVS